MGFFDKFRKEKSPVQVLMDMDEKELRSFHARVEVDLEDTTAKIGALKREFTGLIERGRSVPDKHQKLLLAKKAQGVRRRLTLLNRDFQGQLKTFGMAMALSDLRAGMGSKAKQLASEMEDLLGLSPREMSQALRDIYREHELSTATLDRFDGLIEEHSMEAELSGEKPAELALMEDSESDVDEYLQEMEEKIQPEDEEAFLE